MEAALQQRLSQHKKPLVGVGAGVLAIALLGGGFLVLNDDSAQAYTREGGTLANADDFVAAVEESCRDFIAEEGAETLTEPALPLAFLATAGDVLTDQVACGVSMHAGHDVGGYATHLVRYEQDEETGAITASLDAEASWQPHGDLPAGTSLSRPDGVQALPGDVLTRDVPPTPVIETRDVLVEVETEPEIVEIYRDAEGSQIITPTGTTTLTTAGRADTVTTPDGTAVRAPSGFDFLTLEADIAGGDEAEVVVGEERVALRDGEPTVVLVERRVPVYIEVEVDGVAQQVDVRTGERDGDREEELAWLYEDSQREPAYPREGSRIRWSDSNQGVYSVSVDSVEAVPYVAGVGWGSYYAVRLSGEGFQCSQAGYVDARDPSGDPAVSAITHDRTRLYVEGAAGEPAVSARVENGSNTILYFEAEDMDAESFEVHVAPDVACQVDVIMSDEVTDYMVAVPDLPQHRIPMTSEGIEDAPEVNEEEVVGVPTS